MLAFRSLDLDSGFVWDDVFVRVTFLCGECEVCDGYRWSYKTGDFGLHVVQALS